MDDFLIFWGLIPVVAWYFSKPRLISQLALVYKFVKGWIRMPIAGTRRDP